MEIRLTVTDYDLYTGRICLPYLCAEIGSHIRGIPALSTMSSIKALLVDLAEEAGVDCLEIDKEADDVSDALRERVESLYLDEVRDKLAGDNDDGYLFSIQLDDANKFAGIARDKEKANRIVVRTFDANLRESPSPIYVEVEYSAESDTFRLVDDQEINMTHHDLLLIIDQLIPSDLA